MGPNTIPPPPEKWLDNGKACVDAVPLNLVVKKQQKGQIISTDQQIRKSKSPKNSVPAKIKNKSYERNLYAEMVKDPKKNKLVTKKDQDTTYESHPNMSRIKRQGKKDSKQLSDIDSESEWESSYIISDGPIQLALDPSQKFREGNKPEKNQRKPLNPQRIWEPERPINVNLNPQQTYNVPNHSQDYYYGHSSVPAIQNSDHYRGMPKNHPERKTTSTRSFQVSTIGKNGEEVFEEQIINEDGEQVLHKTSYKMKINQQRLDELENEEDLISMNKKNIN